MFSLLFFPKTILIFSDFPFFEVYLQKVTKIRHLSYFMKYVPKKSYADYFKFFIIKMYNKMSKASSPSHEIITSSFSNGNFMLDLFLEDYDSLSADLLIKDYFKYLKDWIILNNHQFQLSTLSFRRILCITTKLIPCLLAVIIRKNISLHPCF